MPIVTNEFGAIGYCLASIAFLLLMAMLLTKWRGHAQGLYLMLAVGVTSAWAVTSAFYSYFSVSGFPIILFLAELAMMSSWLLVLLKLFSQCESELITSRNRLFAHWWGGLTGYALCLLVLVEVVSIGEWAVQALLVGFIALTVLGVVLIEQVYHGVKKEKLWAVKFLVIGCGALFIYNFYLYADAFLFGRVDAEVWYVRGYAIMLLAPLIAVFVVRNPKWSFDVFISRGVIFHSATLLLVGGYLVVMAAGGYYLQMFGGDKGRAFQILFLFGALILLVFILLSGRFRSRIRVLVDKHFFNYKYDYREEWLGFTKTLSDPLKRESDTYLLVLRALLDIVDSPEGMLWLSSEDGYYRPKARVGMGEEGKRELSSEDALLLFLEETEWVVNIDEYKLTPEMYQGLELPGWLEDSKRGWLVAPLIERDKLFAVALFSHPRTKRTFNWEDSDLLKAAGRQAAVSLSQFQMSQALVDARQFEAFNRFSAFIIHDIKNMVAQLSLMVRNAEKHKHNPEFIDDMIDTTKNSVKKMERMIAQLRTGTESFFQEEETSIDVLDVLADIVLEKSGGALIPCLGAVPQSSIYIKAEKERLVMVIGHLVQNAIDATSEDGEVTISCYVDEFHVHITIIDTGIGMSEAFIKDRLFRPFDSTKGSSGMGIGAYESRAYILQIGGKLNVKSQVNAGSTFHVILPLSNDDLSVSDSIRCGN